MPMPRVLVVNSGWNSLDKMIFPSKNLLRIQLLDSGNGDGELRKIKDNQVQGKHTLEFKLEAMRLVPTALIFGDSLMTMHTCFYGGSYEELMLRSRPEQLKLGIGGARCVDE